mmetsp:Transcript_49403/g.131094  ORF Transcript_49403/g.131094 Transcript_49403/m.131094 type:complete len:263 (+) Transcript_49403:942-1730(+)
MIQGYHVVEDAARAPDVGFLPVVLLDNLWGHPRRGTATLLFVRSIRCCLEDFSQTKINDLDRQRTRVLWLSKHEVLWLEILVKETWVQLALLIMHEGERLEQLLHDRPDFALCELPLPLRAHAWEPIPELPSPIELLNLRHVFRFVEVLEHFDDVRMVQTRHALYLPENILETHLCIFFVYLLADAFLARSTVDGNEGDAETAFTKLPSYAVDAVQRGSIVSDERRLLGNQWCRKPCILASVQLIQRQSAELILAHVAQNPV